MKNLALITLILLIANCAIYAPANNLNTDGSCNYYKNEIDEFSGKQIKQTYGKLIREFSGANANMIVEKVGTSFFIKLNYNLQYPEAIVVGTDDALLLKLSNNQIVKLFPIKIYSGNMNTVNSITTTQIIITYAITRDQVLELSNNTISKVRINFSDGYREHDTKPKNAIETKEAFYCILQ